MSLEASVEELYGDSKDDDWKKEEVARLKAEQGIQAMEEPGVNMVTGGFQTNIVGGAENAGKGTEQNLHNEPEGVPGAFAGGQRTGS